MEKKSKGAMVFKIAGVVFFLLMNVLLIFNVGAARWRHSVDFEQYEKDFNCIAQVVLSEYEAAGCSGSERMVFKIGRDYNQNYFIANNNIIVKLNAEQQESMNNIIKAYTYEYSYPNEVVAYEDRVSFHITAEWYALIYSVDGTEPTFVNRPSEKQRMYTREINENWYHAVAK